MYSCLFSLFQYKLLHNCKGIGILLVCRENLVDLSLLVFIGLKMTLTWCSWSLSIRFEMCSMKERHFSHLYFYFLDQWHVWFLVSWTRCLQTLSLSDLINFLGVLVAYADGSINESHVNAQWSNGLVFYIFPVTFLDVYPTRQERFLILKLGISREFDAFGSN